MWPQLPKFSNDNCLLFLISLNIDQWDPFPFSWNIGALSIYTHTGGVSALHTECPKWEVQMFLHFSTCSVSSTGQQVTTSTGNDGFWFLVQSMVDHLIPPLDLKCSSCNSWSVVNWNTTKFSDSNNHFSLWLDYESGFHMQSASWNPNRSHGTCAHKHIHSFPISNYCYFFAIPGQFWCVVSELALED